MDKRNAQDEDGVERGSRIVSSTRPRTKRGRRFIITIGINKYREQIQLSNAVSDAEGMHKLFTEIGFDAPVPPLLDAAATKERIEQLINDQLADIITEDDTLVAFFAGHGVSRKIGKRTMGYLVPVDATDTQWSSYLRIDHFLDNLNLLSAKHIFVILDACHSGFALSNQLVQWRSGKQRYENALLQRRGRYILTSAMEDQLALDSGIMPGHSLFTGTLIEGVRSGKATTHKKGWITASELCFYTQAQVMENSRESQIPRFGRFAPHTDQGGELILNAIPNLDDDGGKSRDKQRVSSELLKWLQRIIAILLLCIVLLTSLLTIPSIRNEVRRYQARSQSDLVLINDQTVNFRQDNENLYRIVEKTSPTGLSYRIPPYRIEKTEVSNQQYQMCVEAEVCVDPDIPSTKNRDHAVSGVDATEAETYCAWIGRTLPTEVQWELALGDDTSNSVDHRQLDKLSVQPVAEQLHVSPLGVINLLGNVSEWTRTWGTQLSKRPYNPNDVWDGRSDNFDATAHLIYRGDSYGNEPSRSSRMAGKSSELFGIRCVEEE